jgi:hypothetical protein
VIIGRAASTLINPKTQRIESFLVHEGLQEIVGEEDRRIRYVVFLAMLGIVYVLADLIVRARFTAEARVFFLILLGVAALALAGAIRPWHRRIVIDRNGPECRVQWRFLYFLPGLSRTYSIEGKVLDVGTITHEEAVTQGGSGETPWGCLVLFIPFPFNLLAGAFSKPAEAGKVIVIPRRVPVLMLRDRSTAQGTAIVSLTDLKVADPLLRAVGELLPDNVALPPEVDPEFA